MIGRKTSRRMSSIILVLTAVVVVVLALGGSIASSASSKLMKVTGASYVYNQKGSTVPVYGRASTSSVLYKRLDNGEEVEMVCWKDVSKSFTGNYASKRWFNVWYFINNWTFTRTTGWVHSSYVYYQTKVGRC